MAEDEGIEVPFDESEHNPDHTPSSHHVQWIDVNGNKCRDHGPPSNSSHDHEDTKKTIGTEGTTIHPSTPQRPSETNGTDPDIPETPNLSSRRPSSLKIGACLVGMRKDLRARLPLYRDDWRMPFDFFKVLNATIFAFVVQLIPALIFAELMDKTTHGSLGVAETLLSAGIIGILYAVLSGQPLVLVGITGPVAILLGTSYRLSDQFSSDYWPFFWWLCIWTSILHLMSAMIGLVKVVWKITPFTTQIFEFFIASTFIFESIRDLVEPIQLTYSTEALVAKAMTSGSALTDPHALETSGNRNPGLERSAAYAGLVIGIGTFYLCWILHFAETWVSFTPPIRTFLASYNMMIALIIMTGLSCIPGVDQGVAMTQSDGNIKLVGGLERVHVVVPWDWQPTADRKWIVHPLEGITGEGIFGALFPALMLYLLFFIDHNISSILTQSPKYNLQKPPAYHWDFFVLGLTIIPCGILGLPPGSGLIPQAPLHTRALCTRKHEIIHGRQHEVFYDCEEQRWSALIQAALMFLALACMRVISWIPSGCLFGVFLYLGVGAMHGNEIWERITLMIIPHKSRPKIPVVQYVSKWRIVVVYTLLQIMLAAITFCIAQFVSWGYVFPALIAGFVPIRSYLVTFLFDENDLKFLDPVEETDNDYIVEQIEYEETSRPKQISEFGLGLSEFRIGNVPHDPDEYYERHPERLAERSVSGDSHGSSSLGLRTRHSNPF